MARLRASRGQMVIVKMEPTVVSGVGCGAMAVENNGRGQARQVGFHQGNGNHFRGNRDGRPRSHQPIKICDLFKSFE